MMHNLLDTRAIAYLPLNIDMFCLCGFTVLMFHAYLMLTLCTAEKLYKWNISAIEML